MYAFVDRPVESLCNGGRFLLWAMRAWVSAAERGRCPPQMLHRGFAAVNAAGALPDFHIAMALLGGEGVETLVLAPMPCLQRSEEHTSELQSLMSISYAVFCLKNKKPNQTTHT